MGKINKSNFGYLGVDFQHKLVNAFIVDKSFFKDMSTIIDQNVFSESYLKTIVGLMKDYYNKYDSVPSYDLIGFKLKERCNTEEDLQMYGEALDKLKSCSTEGIEEIEDSAMRFFKQQNWVRLANEILKIAENGDSYDEIVGKVEEMNAITRDTDELSAPLESIDEDLSKENVVTIPVGVSKIDDCLGGGIDKGKVGLIMASMGSGKTSATTAFAAFAATYRCEQNDYMGYKVLHIIFEDTKRDIKRKYFGRFTQIETRNLNKDDETTEQVRSILKNHKDKDIINNNIRILRLSTGEYAASEIIKKIKKKINEGFKPDMIIVDYFECVKAEKGSSTLKKWDQETQTMRVFENAAKDLDVAFWIPSQGNRESVSTDLITLDKGSGSIGKQQVAQVVLSITRSVDDINNQKATFAILKNRSGSAGVVLNGIKFNNGTCTIECDEVIDFDDVKTYNDFVTDYEEKRVQTLRSNMAKELEDDEIF